MSATLPRTPADAVSLFAGAQKYRAAAAAVKIVVPVAGKRSPTTPATSRNRFAQAVDTQPAPA